MVLTVSWHEMDWAVFGSTVALALFTLALVWFTRRLAIEARLTRDEMQLARLESETARLQSVRPRLALGMDNLGAGLGLVGVSNVGHGAAINVDAALTFEGLGETRQVAFHLIPVGGSREQQFMTPRNAQNELMRMDELTAACRRITLVGSMFDALGNRHVIDESIDIAGVWEHTVSSNRRLPPDYVKQSHDELEKLRKAAERIAQTTADDYWRRWMPRNEPDEPDGSD